MSSYIRQRMLILITHRPEFASPWQRFDHVGVLQLGNLSRRQCIDMVRDITGDGSLPDAVLDDVGTWREAGLDVLIPALGAPTADGMVERCEAFAEAMGMSAT